MTGYCVSDVAAVVGGALSGSGAAAVTGVVIDSRMAGPGSLFAALPGAHVDGHDYIARAFENGAACCLALRVPAGETRPIIVVPDVAAALERLAADYRARLDIPVLGVTGSVGKTTAKEMVAAVLSQRFSVLKTEKNLNNQLGVPLTLFRIEPEHEIAVVEMGVSHFGDMAPLAAMVRPTAMLFTVIGRAHLEFFGDRAGVFREKTSVLDTMPEDSPVFCNGDDDLLRGLECRQRKVTFGLSEGCAVRAEDVRALGSGGTACTIVWGERRLAAHIPAYGEHMVHAALEGAAVGFAYGLTDAEILRGIAAYRPVGGRAGVVQSESLTIIDDCYNANPDSTAAALRSLRTMECGRRVAILGDMGELGEAAAALHRETGRIAAEQGIDLLVTCGALAANIAAGARDAGMTDARQYDAVPPLLDALPELIRPGDCVLVKASHYMQFEKIVEALKGI